MNQEKRTLKIYSAEFRASSVKLAIDSDLPIAHTAKDLGINPNTLHTWINKYSQPKDQNKAVRTDLTLEVGSVSLLPKTPTKGG